MGVYASGVAATALLGRRTGRSLPEAYAVQDLLVGVLATHKFARIVTKEGITTPVRAPFTDYEDNAGSAEVNESPKHDARHSFGELLTCPFCMAPWVATGYVAGLALNPRLARAWASTFAIVGGSDFLQHAYAQVRTD
jgi:hypothetical protein